jgi:hypothetical protein
MRSEQELLIIIQKLHRLPPLDGPSVEPNCLMYDIDFASFELQEAQEGSEVLAAFDHVWEVAEAKIGETLTRDERLRCWSLWQDVQRDAEEKVEADWTPEEN